MTSPVIKGDQQIPPEDLIELLRANLDQANRREDKYHADLDATEIQLATAIGAIDDQTKIIRFLKDLTRQPDPVVQAIRVRVDEAVRAEVRMKSRIKVLEASEDRLCISANDRAANTCKLASAALSHLAASAQADPDGPNPYIHHDSPSSWKEHSNCIQAAIDLLKPLATGVHDIEPWQEGGLTNFGDTPKDSVGMTVLNNDNYDPNDNYATRTGDLAQHLKLAHGIDAEMCTTIDAPDIRGGFDPDDPSMGDDPWNEWGTHDKYTTPLGYSIMLEMMEGSVGMSVGSVVCVDKDGKRLSAAIGIETAKLMVSYLKICSSLPTIKEIYGD